MHNLKGNGGLKSGAHTDFCVSAVDEKLLFPNTCMPHYFPSEG